MKEKKWRKPELLVLARNKPEERVLQTLCKTGEPGEYPNLGCYDNNGATREIGGTPGS